MSAFVGKADITARHSDIAQFPSKTSLQAASALAYAALSQLQFSEQMLA